MNSRVTPAVRFAALLSLVALMPGAAMAADRVEGLAGFKQAPDAALSTRLGGNGAVVFFGLAKPVRTPLIGPVQHHRGQKWKQANA